MKRGRSKRQAKPNEPGMATGAPERPVVPLGPSAPAPAPPAPSEPRAAKPLPAGRGPGAALALAGLPGNDLPLVPLARRLPRWLVPPVDDKPWPLLWFVVALAVIWAIGTWVRLGWLIDFGWAAEAVQWKGTPFLTSADGYYFASGVQAALAGDTHGRFRIPAPEDHALVGIGWLVGKLTSLSPDTIALYTPAVLAPAIAVPVAAIGRALGRSGAGLVAALAMVVAPGFYMRTTAGYFDTDTFAVTVPLVATACLVTAIVDPTRRARWGIAAAAVLAWYPFFYDQGHPVGMSLAGVSMLYLAALHRKDAWTWPLVAALGLSQARMHWLVLVPLVIATPIALRQLELRVWPRLPALAARWGRVLVPIVVALYGLGTSVGWSAAVNKLGLFAGTSPITAGAGVAEGGDDPDGVAEPVFSDTTKFVAEAQKLPLKDIGRRVLGHLALALVAGLGLLLMVLRQRALLLIAPIAGLGLFSIIGGLRFTIYLSPVAALGAGWIVAILAGLPRPRWARWALGVPLALALAWPGYEVVTHARPRPSVVQPEVAALDALRQRLQPGDVVVSWWDYGYAISYFTQARTVVDGGRRAEDTNLVAEMFLGTSQHVAANLARITVDTLARRRGGGYVAWHIFEEARARGLGPAAFLSSLDRADAPGVPRPSSAIYFYLPARMMTILPAIDQLRPMEAGQKRAPVRGAPPIVAKADGERLLLPGGGVVDGKSMTVKSPRGERKLKRIYSVAGGAGQPVQVRTRDGDPRAPTNGVFLRNTGLYTEMDDRLVDSVFVQLFAFERADPQQLELVFTNEAAKIYKLR